MRLSPILEICLFVNVGCFLLYSNATKKVDWFPVLLCFQMLHSQKSISRWVSGNQRPALGTAVAWDRRSLGKPSLGCSCVFFVSVQGKAGLSAAQDGVGMLCAPTQTSKSSCLSPQYSQHQRETPAWLSRPSSHQLTLPILPLLPP